MKRTLPILSSLALSLLAASAVSAADLPNFDASYMQKDASPAASSAPAGTKRPAGDGWVTSVDPRTGEAAFVWASRPAPAGITALSYEQAAKAHLSEYAETLGVSGAALASARIVRVHDTGRGAVIAVLRQVVGDVPLFHHDAKVIMRRDRSLVAISGGLSPLAIDVPKVAAPFKLPAGGAVARALSDLHSASIPASFVTPTSEKLKDGWVRFAQAGAQKGGSGSIALTRPARAKRVYFEVGKRLVPAYHVEVSSKVVGERSAAYGYVIAADDGRVLQRQNLRADASFSYRVWADPSGDFRPMDGPIADFTPHKTGTPDGSFPPFIAPELITIDGFNKMGDPWLPAGAAQTTGNNVDAYTDHDDSNGPDGPDVHATTTAAGVFDRVYDPLKSPVASPEQQMAAVTQLFYTINWLHDYWYDSGFDEKAGVAQQDNYGRGGAQGDPILAEGQDAYDLGASDNANMETPNDGDSPRMQMYVWTGKDTPRSITFSAGPSNAPTGVATFGPPGFNITADVALVNDGTGTVTDACDSIKNGNEIAGAIALIDRGSCSFQSKAVAAEAAGAVGVIIVNNQAGAPPTMPGAPNQAPVNIPVMSITMGDGDDLKQALKSGPVMATLYREEGIQADGTIDTLVIAHEWGHYLHHRLLPACGLGQCGAQSEGWGDLMALMMQVRPADNLDGAFPDCVYAAIAGDNGNYFGIRRFPYSTDMTKNPLTFKHIMSSESLPNSAPMQAVFADNAETHNAGEIWALMMFEAYVALLKETSGGSPKYAFDEARRVMADYVVGGLTAAVNEPTFTEQRDGVISAALAADPEDALTIAKAFAKRGAGSCAISPAKDSPDNEGVVESFEVGGALSLAEVTIDDSKMSCDNDGLLDAHEMGQLTVTLKNKGFLPAKGGKLSVASSTAGVTFPSGDSIDVGDLEPFGSVTKTFDVQIDPEQNDPGIVAVKVIAESASACNSGIARDLVVPVHYDNVPNASTKDEFESDLDVWNLQGNLGDEVWQREIDGDGNHVWHGVDYPSLSDTALVSPELQASATESLVLSFRHKYKFETSNEDPNNPGSPIVFWDGSVIEVSSDGGKNWDDISQFGDPGYTGTIGNLADNPLAERDGYTDVSASWPDYDDVTIDLGAAFAGKKVMFRFRAGSDQAASEEGWFIDDVALSGIEGAPFPTVKADAQVCYDEPPVADAGPDQKVIGGSNVKLDASKSSDPDGDELTFAWSQVSGPTVTLTGTGALSQLKAPEVDADTRLMFLVKVTAKGVSAEDTVEILVTPSGAGVEAAGGCDCAAAGSHESVPAPLGGLSAALLGLFALRRRGRASGRK